MSPGANGQNVRQKKKKNHARLISSTFREHARPVLNLIDDLRKIGVQKCVPIPQIAVMGDQSSGKSSVLEAISGISFPRSAGLCTRCPTQVTMTQGEVWSAAIRIGNDQGAYNLKDGEQEKIPVIIQELTEKLAGASEEGGFSKAEDYIEISLTAPNVPDLTIIDLPGIVRTSTVGQGVHVVNQVNTMLDRFLKQERTIILAVIPACVDIATVDILQRARLVDPDGKRTIGVLTKPDMVNPGAESEVIQVLSNLRVPLLHGYYMVKNRSQNELNANQSHADARKMELQWLRSSKYSDIPGISNSRLGTEALTSSLSRLLVERIEAALPDMKAEVDKHLKRSQEELARLGRPPPDSAAASREIGNDVVRTFCTELRKTTSEAKKIKKPDGSSVDGILTNELQLRKKFADEIQATKPPFDGEKDSFTVKVTKSADAFSNVREANVLHHNVSEIVTIACSKFKNDNQVQEGKRLSFDYSRFGFTEGYIVSVEMFRAGLAKRMENYRGRELPGFMSFPLFCDQMEGYVEKWKTPTESYFTSAANMFTKLSSILLHHISGNSYPKLTAAMEDELVTFARDQDNKVVGSLEFLISMEKKPATQNPSYLDDVAKYRDDRMSKELRALLPANSTYLEINTVLSHLKSTLGNNSAQSNEVQQMTDFLKAYWNLAHKRFIDMASNVVTETYTDPKQIDGIEKRLSAVVNNADEGQLRAMFRGSHRIDTRRHELEHLVQSMMKARDRLRRGI